MDHTSQVLLYIWYFLVFLANNFSILILTFAVDLYHYLIIILIDLIDFFYPKYCNHETVSIKSCLFFSLKFVYYLNYF